MVDFKALTQLNNARKALTKAINSKTEKEQEENINRFIENMTEGIVRKTIEKIRVNGLPETIKKQE
jgi:hypothetical protein